MVRSIQAMSEQKREHVDDMIAEFTDIWHKTAAVLLELHRAKKRGIMWFVDGAPDLPDNVVPVDFNHRRH